MHRRDFIRALSAGAALPLAGVAPLALADTYPSKPIRLVVTQGTGSGSDVIGACSRASSASGSSRACT